MKQQEFFDIKPSLIKKIEDANFDIIFRRKGYTYFTNGLYNLNIIGIRANNNRKVTNTFDDAMVVTYKNEKGWQKLMYAVTTDPGKYYMMKSQCNIKGTAILVPGQYRGCWKIGKHNGQYTALVQTKPIKVYRDNNKDDIYDYDPNSIDNGLFGINIHRSNQYHTSKIIDNWSAGCQVFANPTQFHSFISLCKKQEERYGNSFTYTLLMEEDL